jgi:hypothetical protein
MEYELAMERGASAGAAYRSMVDGFAKWNSTSLKCCPNAEPLNTFQTFWEVKDYGSQSFCTQWNFLPR